MRRAPSAPTSRTTVSQCSPLGALASSTVMVSTTLLWRRIGGRPLFCDQDECEGPPNFKELADTTGFGLNYNGSVCLNNICMCVFLICWAVSRGSELHFLRWANVTVGLPCVVQNTAYTAYGPDGEFVDIVSR